MEDSYLAYLVKGYYNNGGERAYIVRVAPPEDLDILVDESPNGTASATPQIEAKAAQAQLGPITLRALTAGPDGNIATFLDVDERGVRFLLPSRRTSLSPT